MKNKSTLIVSITLVINLMSQSFSAEAASPSYSENASAMESRLNDSSDHLTDSIEDEDNSRVEHFRQLISVAENKRNAGEFYQASQLLEQALLLAQERGDKKNIAVALGALANIYIAIGPAQKAFKHLTQAEALARELNQPLMIATVLINLGNYYAFQNKPEQALIAYRDSMVQAARINRQSLIAKVLANSARVTIDMGQPEKAHSLLNRGLNRFKQLPPSSIKNHLRINLARSYLRLQQNHPNQQIKHTSYQLLSDAITVFVNSNDIRGESYARGILGQLYEIEKRYPEALDLTQQALFKAQQINDSYLLYRWLWQKARIFKAMGYFDPALKAYRDAINLLDTLRFQMLVAYQAPGVTFSEIIAPVYAQLIELLLSRVESTVDINSNADTLREIRDTVERLKVAEIRDYFGDECVDALQVKSKPLWKASTTALIVYPILLKDRTELLMDFPDGNMKIHRVPITLTALTREIRTFRKLLEKQTTYQYRTPGTKLYNLLIKPLLQVIQSTEIDTLVFVPDGPLLSIPISALYDGQNHLIEQYAVAITPSVQLIDPQPLSNQSIKPLLGGLTVSIEGYPALAYVKDELEYIRTLYGGELLLDKKFQALDLKKSLTDEQINLVHLSTHGFLGQRAENSFLLTFDGHLSINSLTDYVGRFKFRKTPLELLVLSACETAKGYDRAALGLSGIAIRAGARSAIGSLWKVNDAATALLMKEFYQQFQQPGVSRAKALQKAQVAVMRNRRFRHPGYWSAFLLINNWL